MRRFRAFLRLTRPEFLVGGLVFFWLGTRGADGGLTWPHYLAGQGMVSSVQLFAQYVNEHFDQATDAVTTNRTWFSGGSGVLPAGRLHELTALRAAAVAGTAALGFGIWSATFDGRLAVVGLVGLVGSWLYSAPPARLIATGAGEAVASLIVTGLVPLAGALSRGAVDWTLLGALTFPLVLANLAMLLAVDAPDEVADEATGKRTLWVRLGSTRAVSVHGGLLLAVLAALLALAPWRPAWSTGLALATTPLFAAQHYLVRYGRTGRRAYALTLSAIGSLAALALGMGAGTLL